MKLSHLSKYKNIVLQTHNIPDADAVSSAYVLQKFFEQRGCSARVVYGGPAKITKPSLLMFIETYNMKIDFVSELPANTELLITVDCQYGAGNVQKFTCEKVAIIDHHILEVPQDEFIKVNPKLGSCATLVYAMLLEEKEYLRKELKEKWNPHFFDMSFEMALNIAVENLKEEFRGQGVDDIFEMLMNIDKIENFLENKEITTALYYGLFTDTNALSEMRHPMDKDLSEVYYEKALIKRLKNATITMPELLIMSNALSKRNVIDGIGLFKAEPCDPNILGFSSDIAMQVDSLDACVLYSMFGMGIKLSVRSCSREIMANEFAAFLCEGHGSGGGNLEKAGGFLRNTEEYLISRLKEYNKAFDKIYAGKTVVDFASMKRYKKLPIEIGFARLTDLFKEKTKLTIRTLEGDVDLEVKENIYIMIGVEGEVYTIDRDKFAKDYKVLDKKYEQVSEYPPTVIDRNGEKHSILECAKVCVPASLKLVRAQQIKKRTKVFTHWDTEKYFSGIPGDFLAAGENEFNDCYIINERIFYKTYEEV